MALFPPAPPASFPEMRPGPTSGYFQRQERAFFAQAGKEIVRVRVEIDVPHEGEDGYAKAKSRDSVPPNGVPRSWPQLPSHPQHHSSPSQTSAAPPLPHPHAGSSRQTRAVPIQMQQTSLFPMTPHGQAAQPPPNLHAPTSHHTSLGLQTPPHDSHSGAPGAKVEFQTAEEYREESDEAWRRPMPYADRRRAGKHTRRVIVRN
ncbi:hypothetical protein SERLADRAFT_477439 [Serpula lacrymans var. lacrymans S7.9]|nr:uncharacterized protein SERLADRAFT_477439 [Serpula lacrymans var. lacrymans S7.9]EGO20128.1 hypothetical protein SERLADRAFT_477439 [Serpula lacrymans var. lacrymans S7.9]